MPIRAPSDVWQPLWHGFVRLLRSQATNTRQSMAALLITTATNVVAGITLGFMAGTLEALPGLIVLVPAAIGMRGNIFGTLGSRLGTAIHTGEFAGRLERANPAGQSVIASAALTLYLSVALAFLARETTRFFGVDSITFLDFLVISVVGGVLSSVFVLAFTLWVAAVSVRRNWDMDNVAAPMVTAAGDLVTLPALWVATFLLLPRHLPETIGVLTLVALAYTAWTTGRRRDLRLSRRIVAQSLPILVVAGLIDVLAGVTIEHRIEEFLLYPALFVLIPPFLADAGAMGGILSARLATKLHLGAISPRGFPETESLEDIALIYLMAAPVFALVGIGATLASAVVGLAHPGVWAMIGVALVGGFLAITGAVFIAYYTAVLSFRLGLDPDNYGIPAITSSMDLLGVLALLVGMFILGVAG